MRRELTLQLMGRDFNPDRRPDVCGASRAAASFASASMPGTYEAAATFASATIPGNFNAETTFAGALMPGTYDVARLGLMRL